MYGQNTTTDSTRLLLDEDDKTRFLTVEERLRFFEGSPLPGQEDDSRPSGRLLPRILRRLIRR